MTNNAYHPFEPSLRPNFSAAAWRASEPCRHDGRELFYCLMHQSEQDAVYPAAYDFIDRQLAGLRSPDSLLFVQDGREGKAGAEPVHPLPQFAPLELNGKTLQSCLLQLSPVILTEPCWLQSISQAATSEEPLAIDLMAVYLALTKGETCRDLFHALALSAGLKLLPLTSRMYAEQKAVSTRQFDFAATQLALSCYPRVFFPEILGFTLAYCRFPSPLQVIHSSDADQGLRRYANSDSSRKNAVLPAIHRIIDDYLKLFSDRADDLRLRIQSGYGLYRNHAEGCYRQLAAQMLKPPSPTGQWVELLKDKASSALGHHRKIRLADRSLDDWFAQSPFDSSGFVSALKQSPYIDRANPENSPLLRLFEFNGPMFGVLNDEEREILETWLTAIDEEFPAETPEDDIKAPTAPRSDRHSGKAADFTKLGNRELYYYLVNAELYPEVLAAARNKVHKVLRFAGLFKRLPFFPYSHQAFEQYIDGLYRHQIKTHQPVESRPRLSKEAYLWGIEQFAPAILADGCWLQHIKPIEHDANPVPGGLLFKIYEDEIGNGKLERNHPFIYRQLLNSVHLNLPPILSRQFIEHPGFIESAFDLPVYLLSISKFPGTFFPELLGLNMAIELSGLGNVYLRLSEELRFWGINPAIVDLHVSIDNVSSGHAFLARRAIQVHQDSIASGFGTAEANRHWRRIFAGYCSLQSACRGFTFALVSRYLFNRITRKKHHHC